MLKRKRLSYEEKLRACKLYEQGKGTQKSIANDFGISKGGFYNMYHKYKRFGPESLKMQRRHLSYTKEFKEKVIKAYKNGEGSYPELADKYNISNFAVIARWVLGYNNSNKTTYSGLGGVTMKGRKTTLDERIEIIEFLIENEIDYNKASRHFKVSYQQVYSWYKKYLELGVEGLADRRGRKKEDYELSELELLRRENERLKRELELSRAAEIVLKKKQELEEKAHLRELETRKRIKR